ncbi:MAG: nuclear transport factor 2 family protein [Gammaproteobacteria bacterium]|nr:nuclear transport factor 2 family protein [Gammaproteobacteria bacterium]
MSALVYNRVNLTALEASQPSSPAAANHYPNMTFNTPSEAEAAFYTALETADLKLMMSVWSNSEDIICIHPMAARLSGTVSVESAWRHMFQHPLSISCRVTDRETLNSSGFAVHVVHENFELSGQDESPQPLIATNIYRQEEKGWQMILHHASPIASTSPSEEESQKLH